MRNKKVIAGIAYLGLIALCVFLVYAVPSIRGMLVTTYIAEQGEITLSDEVDAYVVRDEKVYTAPCDGRIKRLAKTNELYKAGSKIVHVTDMSGNANTDNCFSKSAGYVVYSFDGLEDKFKSSQIDNISKDDYQLIVDSHVTKCSKNNISSKEAIYKIVKNGRFYLTMYIDKDASKKYVAGNTVDIKIDDQLTRARVYSVKSNKDISRVILKCGIMFKGCLTERKISCEVIAANATGLLIHDDSIVKKDGEIGVLVKNKMGQYIFKPICLKADDGKDAVVYQDIYMDEESNFVETLKIYDEIISKPSKEDIANSR